MNEKSGIMNRLNLAAAGFLRTALIGFAFAAMAASAASAATVVLNNGTVVKGDYLSRTDKEITIRDETTRQVRSIKIEFIRDLTLTQAEKATGKDLKLRGGAVIDIGKGGRRHFLVALGGAGSKIIDGPGKALNFGFGGSLIFQYNYLFMGLGLDLHAAYHYNMDKKYSSDYITILPVIVSPMWKFTKYIGLPRAGAGSPRRTGSAQRFSSSRPGTRASLSPTPRARITIR